ncbi:MAG: DUF3047 domain-containing protein [Deltaproteobacteria bacterium]|nr:DUF3047 domain-containing protein [Deltaproteobacteria bacterium]
MKIFIALFVFVFPVLSLAAEPFPALIAANPGARELKEVNATPQMTVDDFQNRNYKLGKMPLSWRTWPFQRSKALKVYKVTEESGERFLRAYDDNDYSIIIFNHFEWDIKKYPILSWRWRATTLPQGAFENNDELNDSACGVSVGIGRLDGKALKYVWSSSLPVGTIVTRREGSLKIKVLDQGTAKVGQWQSHTIDVVKDYKELFGEDLGRDPTGVGILTDANATHTKAGCDYDDFVVSSGK